MNVRHTLSTVFAFGLLASCADSDHPTHTILAVQAQPAVAARAVQLQVTVTAYDEAGVASTKPQSPVAVQKFPYTIDLTPGEGDAKRTFRVLVAALDANGAFAYASVSAGYVAHHTRYVETTLLDDCIGLPMCGEKSTCERGGGCADDTGMLTTQPTHVEVTGNTDAGSTSTTDAGRGNDAGVAANDASGGAVTDAAIPPITTNDAGTPPVGDDAGTTTPPPPACAGIGVGIWDGTAFPDQLTLMADCAFSYALGTCTSMGTYTPLNAATGTVGNFTLNVTSATAGGYSDGVNEYGCLPQGSYACQYQFTGTDELTYTCAGQTPLSYVRD